MVPMRAKKRKGAFHEPIVRSSTLAFAGNVTGTPQSAATPRRFMVPWRVRKKVGAFHAHHASHRRRSSSSQTALLTNYSVLFHDSRPDTVDTARARRRGRKSRPLRHDGAVSIVIVSSGRTRWPCRSGRRIGWSPPSPSCPSRWSPAGPEHSGVSDRSAAR